MNDYLTKPIVRERLAEQLNRWLRPATSASAEERSQANSEGAETSETPETSKALDEEVLAQLRAQIGDDNMGVVLDQFGEEVNDRWGSLEAAFRTDDREQLIREVHTLSSTCRSLGLVDAGDNFQALEEDLRASDSMPPGILEARARLDRGLDALSRFRSTVA